MSRNKHGLTRHIPEAAKEKIRELCGFGCVICGAIPYDYDHFETEFHDCKEHDINDIVLLCDKHHREKESIGLDVIKQYLAANSVEDRDVVFDPTILTADFKIIWPSIQLESMNNNILIDGEEVLKITHTGNPRNPIHIDGVFYDDAGVKICTINKNEFRAYHRDLGDIHCKRYKFEMIAKSGRTILSFRMEPKALIIEEMFFTKNRSFIIGDQEKFIVGNGDHYGDFTNSRLVDNLQGIILNSGLGPLVFCDNQIVLPFMSASMRGALMIANGSGIHWG